MNIKENLIFIKGEDETSKVQSYRSFNGKCHVKYTGADKEYGFNYSNIEFYKANKVYEGNSLIVYKGKMPISGIIDIMCAQHGHVLVGESPIWGLIVPTISLRQGCPS